MRRGFLALIAGAAAEFASPLRALAATVAPPTNVHVTATTDSTITIAWTSTASLFAMWLDATRIERVTAKTYTFKGLQPATTYRCGVRAVKGAGKSSIVYVDAATTSAPTGSGAMSIGAYQ